MRGKVLFILIVLIFSGCASLQKYPSQPNLNYIADPTCPGLGKGVDIVSKELHVNNLVNEQGEKEIHFGESFTVTLDLVNCYNRDLDVSVTFDDDIKSTDIMEVRTPRLSGAKYVGEDEMRTRNLGRGGARVESSSLGIVKVYPKIKTLSFTKSYPVVTEIDDYKRTLFFITLEYDGFVTEAKIKPCVRMLEERWSRFCPDKEVFSILGGNNHVAPVAVKSITKELTMIGGDPGRVRVTFSMPIENMMKNGKINDKEANEGEERLQGISAEFAGKPLRCLYSRFRKLITCDGIYILSEDNPYYKENFKVIFSYPYILKETISDIRIVNPGGEYYAKNELR